MQDNNSPHFGDSLERFLIETASALKRFAQNERMTEFPEAEKRLDHLVRDMFSLACDLEQVSPSAIAPAASTRVRLSNGGGNGARREVSR
jgi:hypothetical protein